jgi:SpoIID/LytB domain protein
MSARRCHALLGVVLVAALWPCAARAGQSAAAPPPSAAFRVIELPSGRTLSSSRDQLLGTPVLPGSILKVATLIAALEAGVIRPDTRILCRRQIEIAGRRITCSHPDIGRPIGPAEALAHSCNFYFASLAARLPRGALDHVLGQLGLPPTTPSVPLASSALGLDGTRMSADKLLSAFVRLTTTPSVQMRDETRAVLMEGLRGAADYGTAAAFADRGISALAKTGTAPMPGGGYEGLVVAVSPAEHASRAVVVMAPGAAGADAARLAADLIGAQVLRIGRARRGGYDVETMPVEEYVSRVVSAEAASSSGPAALQALAIVARTFALGNLHRHERDGFDLCDLTHCQVIGQRTKASDDAARATRGQVLFYQGKLATVYYTASCGGYSERPSAVWPGAADPPYLLARAEPECRAESLWQSEVPARDLQRALVAAGRRGQILRNLVVLDRSRSGRVSRLRIDGFEPAEMTGEDFRLAVGRTLGWQVLKSTLFDIERTAAGYRFRGSGRGHGVGLCVVGSARMAAGGRSASEILARYFPGTEMRAIVSGQAPPSPVEFEISLPAGEERERSRIEGLGRAALSEFSAKIGVPVPARVRLVFHPTVEAYTRASGQPWWTAGATRGQRVDFIPPTVLRERGMLERTLRHELAHVLTADRLKGRPIWVQEAVAMNLAGESFGEDDGPRKAGPGGPASSCPADAEFREVRSAEQLRKLYRRAAACYAAQRAAGRRWDEIR